MDKNLDTACYFTDKLDETTYRIRAFGGERSYLLLGETSAVLIDTTIGYGNLRKICESLTDLPVQVVNTHGHLDHCGGNFDFSQCWMHPADVEMFRKGTTMENRYNYMERVLGRGKVRGELLTSAKRIVVYPIVEGDIIDLGGRKLEVIHVPGHTHGTIVLLERDRRWIFSGDACNKNTLLTLPGSTTVEKYLESLRHLYLWIEEADFLYGGHEDAVSASAVMEGIEVCQEILEYRDDAVPTDVPGQFYAKSKTGDFVRTDGKYMNVAYRRDRITG